MSDKGMFGGTCAADSCEDSARWIPVAHKYRDAGEYYCARHCEEISDNPGNWYTG